MPDKRIIMIVRATQDGVYGNYLWKGPIESDQGYTPGEVFRIDATPYEVKDDKGRPIFQLDDNGQKIPLFDAKGKPILENGKHKFKVKMATFFSKEWMERVSDDTELTYPDRPAWTIPEPYRAKKSVSSRTVPLPADVIEAAGINVPSAVMEAMEKPESDLETVI